MIGTKLAHYEITSHLGSGGMGEVYQAIDAKLGRSVAIKLLPEAFTHDVERAARFEREARVLASLNHSNIAAIYGIEQSGERKFLVMELVGGETLAERIKQGPIPIEEALPIAKQIADALEAAHEKGIIHRDLKPANIKVTPQGQVKVLDFGLAKAFAGEASDMNLSNSPTMMSATIPGMILGTAAYMSPEQAKGKDTDRTTDIWAFGCVFYEMLTGRAAFEGETLGEILGSVFKAEPNWNRLPVETPTAIRRLLDRCLQKDRNLRLRDAADARLEILEPRGEVGPVATQAKGRERLAWIAFAAALLAAVVLGIPAVLHLRETPPELRAINTSLLPPENAEFDFSPPYAIPAISPDGTRIVYGARAKDGKQQLWLRRLDSDAAQPLAGTEGAATPFWSPDSRWVAFGQAGKLKKIDIQGGPPVPITDLEPALRGGSWNQEGVIIFGVNNINNPISRVAASGGKAVPITTEEGSRDPWFLPDGVHFLYIVSQGGDMPVLVGSLDDPGKAGKIVAQAHSPAVYAQGHLLYLRELTLMAQPFDVSQLSTQGEAMPVAGGVPTWNPSRVALFGVSTSGLLVHGSGASSAQSRLMWKDRQGKALAELGQRIGLIGNARLSPDGKYAAVSTAPGSRPEDLWIYDVARGIPSRFTFDPMTDREPLWSPDGATLYFSSDRKRPFDVYRKAANGTGTEELIIGDSTAKVPDGVSPDGKLLLYTRNDPKTRNDLWVLPVAPTPGGTKPESQVFLQTPFDESRGKFSPDGTWVAYQSNESGQLEVYAAPFPGPGGKRQISTGGGTTALWRKDGKEIFYVTGDGQLMAAEVAVRNGTLEVGRVQRLFDGLVTTRGITWDVSADGQKFLVVDDGINLFRPLTLQQNWTASLRK